MRKGEFHGVCGEESGELIRVFWRDRFDLLADVREAFQDLEAFCFAAVALPLQKRDCTCDDPDCTCDDPDCTCDDPDCIRDDPDCIRDDPDCIRDDPDCIRDEPDCIRDEPDCIRDDPDCIRDDPDCTCDDPDCICGKSDLNFHYSSQDRTEFHVLDHRSTRDFLFRPSHLQQSVGIWTDLKPFLTRNREGQPPYGSQSAVEWFSGSVQPQCIRHGGDHPQSENASCSRHYDGYTAKR